MSESKSQTVKRRPAPTVQEKFVIPTLLPAPAYGIPNVRKKRTKLKGYEKMHFGRKKGFHKFN